MGLLGGTIYVRISRDTIHVRHIDDKRQAKLVSTTPFSTTRLLVGDFAAAEQCLKDALRKVHSGGWLSASPVLLLHPLEMVEGGLSPVEERIFTELGLSAGARKCVLWLGPELEDREVASRL